LRSTRSSSARWNSSPKDKREVLPRVVGGGELHLLVTNQVGGGRVED
jgi:hypothetical protein